MRYVNITPVQHDQLVEGETIVADTVLGAEVIITPGMVRDILDTGGQLVILPEVVGTNLMDEVTITIP